MRPGLPNDSAARTTNLTFGLNHFAFRVPSSFTEKTQQTVPISRSGARKYVGEYTRFDLAIRLAPLSSTSAATS